MDPIFRPVTNALTAIRKLFVIQLVHLPAVCYVSPKTYVLASGAKNRLFAWVSSSYFSPCGTARTDAESTPAGSSPSCGHFVAHFYHKAMKGRPGRRTCLPTVIYSAKRKERRKAVLMPFRQLACSSGSFHSELLVSS